ncbi:sporulation phosphorelay system protein KapB [Virgibacillus sp. FSP13]
MTVHVGDIVRAHYNSGVYIGEVQEDRGERFLVKVLAVMKHPMQGDLHHPGVIDDNVFFHERKALAHYEKMNVDKAVIYPYDDEIPNYHTSLKASLATMKEKLIKKDNTFSQEALKKLQDIEEKYYHKSYYK